jgi:hypothetical protein
VREKIFKEKFTKSLLKVNGLVIIGTSKRGNELKRSYRQETKEVEKKVRKTF